MLPPIRAESPAFTTTAPASDKLCPDFNATKLAEEPSPVAINMFPDGSDSVRPLAKTTPPDWKALTELI